MKSDLKAKFADTNSGVYFIGTTPPKVTTPPAQLEEIADKLLARLGHIEVDGLVVYDIQDESSRITAPRPFPYMETHDPRHYSQLLNRKAEKPVITYKSVSQRNKADFQDWLDDASENYGVEDLVLVGSPSSEGEIQLRLPEAYTALQESDKDFHLGGVTIAERHAAKGDEHLRLINKADQGCDFFISQAVYNAQATIDLLISYARTCRDKGIEPKRIILTFTPCGSAKTLEFMEWLGISVPQATRWRILDSADPIAESIRLCRNTLEQILEATREFDLPLGLNIESLTNRKDEIDASIRLYKLLKATMDLALAEKHI